MITDFINKIGLNKEFLDKIGLNKEFVQSDAKTYTLDVDTYDQFGAISSKLDNCDEDVLQEMQEVSTINVDYPYIGYTNDNYDVYLMGNFIDNEYKVVIKDNQITEKLLSTIESNPMLIDQFKEDIIKNLDDDSVESIMEYYI